MVEPISSRVVPTRSAFAGRFADRTFRVIIAISALSVLAIVVLIAWQLIVHSHLSLKQFGLKFFYSSNWDPVAGDFGALPFIYGTLVSSILALALAVPLSVAARNYGLLSSYLEDPDSEWDLAFYLREVCLGRPIDPEQTRALIAEKLLNPDGSPDPGMEAVVLSAVRGEGRALHLATPFTDPLERAMAEFIMAREYIRGHLEAASQRSRRASFSRVARSVPWPNPAKPFAIPCRRERDRERASGDWD